MWYELTGNRQFVYLPCNLMTEYGHESGTITILKIHTGIDIR